MITRQASVVSSPRSGYLEFFGRFLRDESVMLVGSSIATAAFYFFLNRQWGETPPAWVLAFVLPFVGPFLEKPFLFLPYLWKGFVQSRKGGSESLVAETKKVLKEEEFFRTLRADILFHDSFYAGFMFVFTLFLVPQSEIVSGLISALSFILAVFGASLFEVQWVELGFRRFTNRLSRIAERTEHYGEMRRLVRADVPGPKLLERVREPFGLGDTQVRVKTDWAIEGVELPRFNSWSGFLLLRSGEPTAKLHVIFYRTRKSGGSGETPLLAHYIEKRKFVFALEEGTEDEVCRLLQKLFGKAVSPQGITMEKLFAFSRRFASGETFSFAVDNLVLGAGEPPTSFVETKFYLGGADKASDAQWMIGQVVAGVNTTDPRPLSPRILARMSPPLTLGNGVELCPTG